jgi:hypothetical protein
MRLSYLPLVAAFSVAAGCSHRDTIGPTLSVGDHDAQGSWNENTFGVLSPGNSFSVALTESSGVIGGAGSFSGEAGPFGALSISGTVADGVLNLRFVYLFDPTVFPQLAPDTAQFVGVLTTRDRIDGFVTRRGVRTEFGLLRRSLGDPILFPTEF